MTEFLDACITPAAIDVRLRWVAAQPLPAALRVDGRYGLSATVYRGNLFELPKTLEQFYALPHEAFDTPEEIYAAVWRID